MAVVLRRRVIIASSAIVVAVVAVSVGLSLAPPFTSDEGDTVRLSAEIGHLYRSDGPETVIPVLVRNLGSEPVTVDRVELVASTVTTEPDGLDPPIVDPGRTRRIRLVPGSFRCPESGPPSSGPATAVVTVAGSDAKTRDFRLPAPDPEGLLDRLGQTDCARQRVLRVADIGFGSEWQRVPGKELPALRGELVLTRRTAGPAVAVEAVRGSVIFDLRSLSPPPQRLEADQQRLSIPVEFAVVRCDTHGLLDSKRTYVFRLWAELEGEKEQDLELRPDSGLTTRLNELIDACRELRNS